MLNCLTSGINSALVDTVRSLSINLGVFYTKKNNI